LYKNIDTIICVTKALEKQIKKFIPKEIRPKTELLYLGANEPDLLSDEKISKFKNELKVEDAFMIGLIGRINEFKGQYLLIEAMRVLKEKKLHLKAYIVGDAMSEKYLKELQQKVIEYKLEKNVHFIGFTKEPARFMQACDVVLMTSKNETFGLVTIEAMKVGTAVIASNSGGVLEIIDDKENGLLFKNEDYKDLALKIESLYENNGLITELGIEGKRKADEYFDNVKQFEKLVRLFEIL